MERPLALVVDSDPTVRALVREALESKGVMTLGASTGPEAVEVLRIRPLKILVADLNAPGLSGGELLDSTRRLRPTAAVIVLAGEANQELALSSIRAGALDVLFKPLDEFRLQLAAERAIRQNELLEECRRLRDERRGQAGYDQVVGQSSVMVRLRERLERLAPTDLNVMFIGEDGAGKELAARTLHTLSPGKDVPFVAVDCASLPPPSLESELFGVGRGVTSGGEPGGSLLQGAERGVVFLDGVLQLSEWLQDRLIGYFGEQGGKPGVRILSATSRDPRRATEEGHFREDLLQRLAGASVELPPLRERAEDVPLLARHFIENIREINNLPPVHLSPESLLLLERYSWPGNVRELRNAVEQAVILAVEGTIRPRDLPERIRQAEEPVATGPRGAAPTTGIFKEAKREIVEAFERSYLEEVLERHHGNVTAAAQQAGMLRSALQRLLRKYNIRSADFRRGRTEPIR